MKIMSVDYGDSRVGTALSDILGISAHGFKTVPNKFYPKMLESIVNIINDNSVGKVVIGLPKNMDGTLGFRADITHEFADDLQKALPDIEIIFWDERLTTVEAANYLNFTNTRGKARKNVIDTLAAEIILQSYIDANKNVKETDDGRK